MDHKPEVMPCPFCGNDELTAEPESTYVMCHVCDADGPMAKPGEAIKAWNTRHAPAEDARAVGGEPVAWVNPSNLARFKGDIGATAYQCADHQIPLYRHPQRPVVLPERRTVSEHARDQAMFANAWNACIDEFKRLNP